MSSIGDRLKFARERKNLSQLQVKDKTNINNKTLSGYENGVSEPDRETIKLLATVYEVNPSWIIGYEDNPTPRKPQSTVDLSLVMMGKVPLKEVKRLLIEDKVDNVNQKQRRALIALIESMEDDEVDQESEI